MPRRARQAERVIDPCGWSDGQLSIAAPLRLRYEPPHVLQRGRGVMIAGSSERGAVVTRAGDLVEFCQTQGLGSRNVIEIVERVAWSGPFIRQSLRSRIAR